MLGRGQGDGGEREKEEEEVEEGGLWFGRRHVLFESVIAGVSESESGRDCAWWRGGWG